MKAIVVCAGLLALLGPVSAYAYTQQERCQTIGELASAVMSARQSGVVMSTAMGIVNDGSPFKEIVAMMIKKAYDSPQYLTEENKRREITDFRNEIELICYSAE